MAFTPNKLITDGINGGTDKRFQDGDILTPGAVNQLIEGILYNQTGFKELDSLTASGATAKNPVEIDVSGYSNDYEVWITSDADGFNVKILNSVFGAFEPQTHVVIKIRLVGNMFYITIQGNKYGGTDECIFGSYIYKGFDELIYVYDRDGSGEIDVAMIGR